eukprot:g31059.t1
MRTSIHVQFLCHNVGWAPCEGLRCPYAHGAKEQLYHPRYFRTVVCRDLRSKELWPVQGGGDRSGAPTFNDLPSATSRPRGDWRRSPCQRVACHQASVRSQKLGLALSPTAAHQATHRPDAAVGSSLEKRMTPEQAAFDDARWPSWPGAGRRTLRARSDGSHLSEESFVRGQDRATVAVRGRSSHSHGVVGREADCATGRFGEGRPPTGHRLRPPPCRKDRPTHRMTLPLPACSGDSTALEMAVLTEGRGTRVAPTPEGVRLKRHSWAGSLKNWIGFEDSRESESVSGDFDMPVELNEAQRS